jgi:hypothetical protein
VRNAFILLAVVALLFVGAGAANRSLAFDIDYVFGAVTSVSLFWITLVTAAIILVVGLVAAWLARSSAVAGQRKLEVELQTTYERLRAAEARVPSAPVAGSAAADDLTVRLDSPPSPPAGETNVTAPR